jgi:hypothetical protein
VPGQVLKGDDELGGTCSMNSVSFRRIDFPTTAHSSQRNSIANTFDCTKDKLVCSLAGMNATTESWSNVESIAMSLRHKPSTSSSRYLRDLAGNKRGENGIGSLS